MEIALSDKIFKNVLEDVISVGFCDETDNGLEYVMNMDILYLEFDDFMIRLESVENYSKLLIMVEDKICQDYIIDEDMHYAFSKLHNIIFKYGEMAVVYIEVDINSYLSLSIEDKLKYIKKYNISDDFAIKIDKHTPVFIDKNSNIDFIFVPEGWYYQGFTEENERNAKQIARVLDMNLSEMRPVIKRTITHPFLVSRFPVLKSTVEEGTGQNRYYPIFCSYANAIEIADSLQMRLPTEMEWEYFARAGSDTLFPFGNELVNDDELEKWMNYCFFDLKKCNANNLGIYGIFSGEWTSDLFSESYHTNSPKQNDRVIRGGGACFWPWQDQEWIYCISAMRVPSSDIIDEECCFRLIKDIV